MGGFMAMFVAKLIPYYIILYGIANYVFLDSLKGENLFGMISLIIVFAYLLIPINLILDHYQPKVDRDEKDTYRKNRL